MNMKTIKQKTHNAMSGRVIFSCQYKLFSNMILMAAKDSFIWMTYLFKLLFVKIYFKYFFFASVIILVFKTLYTFLVILSS